MISDGSCFLRDEHAVNREINEASAVEARAVGMTINCRRQKMRSFEKRDVFAVDLAVDDEFVRLLHAAVYDLMTVDIVFKEDSCLDVVVGIAEHLGIEDVLSCRFFAFRNLLPL